MGVFVKQLYFNKNLKNRKKSQLTLKVLHFLADFPVQGFKYLTLKKKRNVGHTAMEGNLFVYFQLKNSKKTKSIFIKKPEETL